MRVHIAVTGSIATDHLMSFPGRFAEQIVPEELARISLSFLVDTLEVRRGGVAANIAFGMGSVGLRPLLVGAVGSDFEMDYRPWLEEHGVDTSPLYVSVAHHTARFVCTTDSDHNQLASFYPGAMSEAREIELAPIATNTGGLDLVVVSPNDPAAMIRHTEECRKRGFAFVADPSQQLARMEGEDIRQLVDGAAYLFTNDYERALIEQKTGWSGEEILDRVDVRVTTLGGDGIRIERKDTPEVHVPVVDTEQQADPTGVGDAFRSGFLSGLAWGVPLERCAQVGALLATYTLETVGTQEYVLSQQGFLERLAKHYGDAAAADVEQHLRCGNP